MKIRYSLRMGFTFFVLIQILASFVSPASAIAAIPSQKSIEGLQAATASAHVLAPLVNTNLTVEIVSSPYAVIDSNAKPGELVPAMFVVEAKVTNSGPVAATHLVVSLDYNPDPADNWVLAPGEDPDRTIDQLDSSKTYYAYWFVHYSTTIGHTHQYTVHVSADNASVDPVTGNITTRSFLSTGNSGVVALSYTVVVGTAFTVDVTYDLGTAPGNLIFGPVGNKDFDPGAYRLTSSSVVFKNPSNAVIEEDFDKLYFPSTPATAKTAIVKYTFLALTATDVKLCPYAAIIYSSSDKYDQFYCETDKGTIANIHGTITVSMLKQASRAAVQQGQTIDYTITYTNTGTEPLNYVWIWDEIDPAVGSIVPGSISPAPAPLETNSQRAAWYFNPLPAAGQGGSQGTLRFSVLVDGSTDLANGYNIVNNARFGVNPGSLPGSTALISSATTTVQAPTVTVQKTDNQQVVVPDTPYVYHMQVNNTGAVAAVGVVITDVLPAELTLAGTPNPEPVQKGQTLVWTYPDPIAPNGSPILISVPVKAARATPDGTVISNTVSVAYQNPMGHAYQPGAATDTTSVVAASDLKIEKTSEPNPVAPDDNLTYTYTYTNNGPSVATAVRITDTLPADVTYAQLISKPGTLQGPIIDGRRLVWYSSAPLAEQETGVVQFFVNISPSILPVPKLIGNTVVIHSPVNDQNPGNNGDIAYTVVGDTDNAAIYGVAFDDSNGNGQMDLGEHGIPGVTVTLDNITPTMTAGDGSYFFLTPDEGNHTIVETDPAGYHSTTPNTVLVNVQIGHGYQIDFGDAANTTNNASIFGTVFDDKNGNGLRDAGETGLAGVSVQLDGFETQQTDAYGDYTFAITVPGPHTVVETDPAGFHSTTPNEIQLMVTPGNSYAVNFGDVSNSAAFASVYGTVFDDRNGNGSRDLGEPGIFGVTVKLDGSITTTTNPYGAYTFSTTTPGSHTVVETDPAGFHSTTPNEVQVAVTPGNGYQVDYGDVANTTSSASIYGTVFNDKNGDGLRDAGEPGIPGVTVKLDESRTTTSNTYGAYTFATVAGSHLVNETDPTGYHSTTPNTIHVTVVQGHSYPVDFGDVSSSSNFASIYGTVYEDNNGNTQQDAGEPGIAGVTVKLDNTKQAATNAYGTYTFATTAAGQHAVVETDPAGYASTTPNQVLVTVAAGHGYQADFGDIFIENCTPDGYEKDDTSAQAKSIQFGLNNLQTHNFCGDASDWLTFSARAGQTITITTASVGRRADTNMALYASNSITLLAGNDDLEGTQDFSSRIVWQSKTNSAYTLHLTNRAGLTGYLTDYTVKVEGSKAPATLYLPYVGQASSSASTLSGSLSLQPQAPNGVITHMCPDNYETDDSWELAKPIVPGISQLHSFDSSPALNAADKDVLWFNMKKGDTVLFTVQQKTNTQPLLELYDAAGNALGIAGADQIKWTAKTAGRYYLSASPTTGTFGCANVAGYVLQMQLNPMTRLFISAIFNTARP
ncbi:MAG: SdrD B-like domain-containing protein [Omnitrophica WOR_2 bacterium]